MRAVAILLVQIAFVAGVTAARAQTPVIGIVAPLSGPSEILGKQLVFGAETVALAHETAPDLISADDKCSAEGGAEAASRMVEGKAQIVVGFLCTAAIEAALPVLAKAGIAVITPGVRTDSLTERRHKTGWPVYRTAPRADAERAAVSRLLTARWSGKLFAIVDDGTIYGRELAESFRLSAESAGLEPVFTDTYRPQFDNQIGLASRLKRSGATHVFAGGDRDDIAIIARDAAKIDYPLVIAGGEALRAAGGAFDLAPGTLMVGLPRWQDVAASDATRQLANSGVVPEGYVLPGYAAMQVALEAALQHLEGKTPIGELLDAGSFPTALGPIRFDKKGDRVGNPYALFRYDGSKFVAVE